MFKFACDLEFLEAFRRGERSALARVYCEYVDEVDYIRVYIRRLRDKLGDDPDDPRYIRTERGLGYRFITDADG